MISSRTLILGVLLASFSCTKASESVAPQSPEPKTPALTVDPAHQQEVDAWRHERLARLKAPDGWLTLVGLHWLRPGKQRIGAAPDNDVVLPVGADPYLGVLRVGDDRRVRFEVFKGVDVRRDNGKAVTHTRMHSDRDATPTVLTHGSLSMHVIERGERVALRVKDKNAQALRGFGALDYFEIEPSWRINAILHPYKPLKKLNIPTVVGDQYETTSCGELRFQVAGEDFALDAICDDGDTDLFVVFRDATSGRETYGAGRFVIAQQQAGAENLYELDFNRAYNPPCAFTPYATCPLPPKKNRLAVRITAGEKAYAMH